MPTHKRPLSKLKPSEKGESFAALAKEFSEDPVSAAKGGDIGTFNPDVFGADGAKVAKAIEEFK